MDLVISVGDINTDANNVTVNMIALEPESDDPVGPHLLGENSVSPDIGIYSLDAVAGDEKVYIDSPQLNASSSQCSTQKIVKFRVFYSEVSFDEAGYDGSTYADLEVDSDCAALGDWIIDGLKNDVPYFFRIASVDTAGNVAFLTDVDSGAADDLFTAQAGCGTSTDETCTYIATPGNILGLLPEDLNCFVATAAYGSPFHPIVKILRQFRDQVLKPTTIGQSFIKKYYAVGPKAAHWIADKPIVRSLVRFGLLPFTGAAWIALYYGPWGLTVLFIVSVYGLLVVSQKYRAQKIRVDNKNNDRIQKKEDSKK